MDGSLHPRTMLTRSKSSLLRSTHTIRSSVHSITFVAEDHLIVDAGEADEEEDDDEKKKKRLPSTLYFLSRNKSLVDMNLSILKSLCVVNAKRLSLSRGSSLSVQWYIGDSKGEPNNAAEGKTRKKIIREGVEFYSNGDFYEVEFYKRESNATSNN